MSATTVKEILKQDYDTTKILKEKTYTSSSEILKEVIKKKNFNEKKQK